MIGVAMDSHEAARPKLRWELDNRRRIPVLRFTGVLDGRSAGALIDAVAKSAGDDPGALIIDLDQLRVADPVALTALLTVSHRAAAWPGCRLAVCVSDPRTAAMLRGIGISRYVALVADHSTAMARLSERGTPPTLRESYPPTLDSLQAVRALVHHACEGWRLAEIADRAQSIVTELVTNAIQHAGTRVDVRLTYSGRALAIAVRDGSPVLPRNGGDEQFGLRLVDGFATRWGTDRTADGKIVWASIRLPHARS